ncbi:MAG: DUF2147 domain-containing protein [Gilvibacter sp.]
MKMTAYAESKKEYTPINNLTKAIRFGFLTACFLVWSPIFGQGPNLADAVIGTYWTPDKDAKIEIYKENSFYFGKTIWLTRSGKDTLNPDPKEKGRNLLGMVFLKDFTFEDDQWTRGTIYDPKTGNTYKSKMWLSDGNLKVRGYIGISIFGRSALFERID